MATAKGVATAADVPTAPVGPVRTCVGCRKRDEAHRLVRLAVSPDDTHDDTAGSTPAIRLVVSRTNPGRGAWLCLSVSCAQTADRTGAAARTLRVARNMLVPNAVVSAMGVCIAARPMSDR